MNRLLFAFLAIPFAALAGCVSQDEASSDSAEAPAIVQTASLEPLPQAVATEGPVDALQLPVSYNCAEGRTFTAVFPGHGRSVTVAAAGETRVLPHKGSTDAVLFTDGAATMTADGADATLTGLGDGAYTECMAG